MSRSPRGRAPTRPRSRPRSRSPTTAPAAPSSCRRAAPGPATRPPSAKYANKTAPTDGVVKVGLIKPGSPLKLVGRGLGDTPLDISTAPTGDVYVAATIINGGEKTRLCTRFSDCAHKRIAGGTGYKLLCKGTAPAIRTARARCDPCPTAPPGAGWRIVSDLHDRHPERRHLRVDLRQRLLRTPARSHLPRRRVYRRGDMHARHLRAARDSVDQQRLWHGLHRRHLHRAVRRRRSSQRRRVGDVRVRDLYRRRARTSEWTHPTFTCTPHPCPSAPPAPVGGSYPTCTTIIPAARPAR